MNSFFSLSNSFLGLLCHVMSSFGFDVSSAVHGNENTFDD